ncbi:MAG: hypothetical protein ACU88J_04120 [Gammaproteobacteria bacterium]
MTRHTPQYSKADIRAPPEPLDETGADVLRTSIHQVFWRNQK